jgi:serine/threonine protein phosphatase PrpC
MAYSLDFALKTHPGLVRPLNEDSIGAEPSAGLFVLADGLGGYNAGEIASTMAVSALLAGLTGRLDAARGSTELFNPQHVLRDALVDMNTTIFRAALNSTAFEGMATTVVIAWLLGPVLWVAHTGDSRLYRLRNDVLEQVTRDHSFSQELLDAGMVTEEEARTLPAKNLVTRALGANADIEPEVHSYDVREGDILLLCSDGLTEMVTHHEIEGILAASGASLADAARRLVDMANEAGGRDNISIVLARVVLELGAGSAADDASPDLADRAADSAPYSAPDSAADSAPDSAGNSAAESAPSNTADNAADNTADSAPEHVTDSTAGQAAPVAEPQRAETASGTPPTAAPAP